MHLELFVSAILKILIGILLVGTLIFLPAGTFCYPNGWLFMVVLFVPVFLAGIVMMIASPSRLEKRLSAKEKSKEQRQVVSTSALMFLVGFVLAGLGVRFGWYRLPYLVSVIGAIVLLISYGLYAVVLYQNPFLSRTVEVFENQRVIDTGAYSVVRHPMYGATLLLFLAMPLVLGSLYAFIVFLVYPALIIKRIHYEEILLKKELPGYKEYCKKVKYRLVPFIW